MPFCPPFDSLASLFFSTSGSTRGLEVCCGAGEGVDGCSVGCTAGSAVGRTTGSAVGRTMGSVVGCTFGSSVGCTAGSLVDCPTDPPVVCAAVLTTNPPAIFAVDPLAAFTRLDFTPYASARSGKTPANTQHTISHTTHFLFFPVIIIPHSFRRAAPFAIRQPIGDTHQTVRLFQHVHTQNPYHFLRRPKKDTSKSRSTLLFIYYILFIIKKCQNYASLLFATSTRVANPSGSLIAISESILRLMSISASFKPYINLL